MKHWFCDFCKDRRSTGDSIVIAICYACQEGMIEIKGEKEMKEYGFWR